MEGLPENLPEFEDTCPKCLLTKATKIHRVSTVISISGHVQLRILNPRVFPRCREISPKPTVLSDRLERTASIDTLERLVTSNKLKPHQLAHVSPLNLDLMPVSP